MASAENLRSSRELYNFLARLIWKLVSALSVQKLEKRELSSQKRERTEPRKQRIGCTLMIPFLSMSNLTVHEDQTMHSAKYLPRPRKNSFRRFLPRQTERLGMEDLRYVVSKNFPPFLPLSAFL